MVVREDEFAQWVLAQYRGASTPRGETGPDDPSSAEEYPRGSDVGGPMASRGLPRPSTLSTSRTSPLTRSSGRTAAIPSVVSMPAWCRRVRRQRHRGGRPIERTYRVASIAESRAPVGRGQIGRTPMRRLAGRHHTELATSIPAAAERRQAVQLVIAARCMESGSRSAVSREESPRR
jgi:hypothetical protein